MSKVLVVAAGAVASILVLVTGCGSNKSPSPSSSASTSASTSSAASSSAPATSSSGAAQPSDYSGLLIKPSDIVVAGDAFALTQTLPVATPAGTEGVFTNQGGARKIDDTLYVYPDAGAAGQALDVNAKMLADPDLGVKGTQTPADVGVGGTMAVGTSGDGSKAKAMVMFTQGRALVVLEFTSPPGDPVPPEFVLDVARKQAAAITTGLAA